jgi:hypothetical protein
MQSKPNVAGEAKEHPFAVAFRAEEFGGDQSFLELSGVDAARHALFRVEVNSRDGFSQASIPSSPVKFDFRQFGHDRMLTGDRMNRCPK